MERTIMIVVTAVLVIMTMLKFAGCVELNVGDTNAQTSCTVTTVTSVSEHTVPELMDGTDAEKQSAPAVTTAPAQQKAPAVTADLG